MGSPRISYEHLVGKIVQVFFWDHALGDDLFECAMFGVLVEETDTALKIRYWHCVGVEEEDSNHEHGFILKSAITGISQLEIIGQARLLK
jgi:hypothetical protein